MISNINIQLALSSIKNNKLRTILTVLIIAIGITCLVGILTAIDTILFSLNDNFNRMGANSISVTPSYVAMKRGGGRRKKRTSENISFEQAIYFKDKFQFPGSKTSLNVYCSNSTTASYDDKKTDPSIKLLGVDENFFNVKGFELISGRLFNTNEIIEGANRIVIGNGLVKSLFKGNGENAIGKTIKVDDNKYFVIGVLKAKGTTSSSNDNNAYIPLLRAKFYYGHAKSSYHVLIALSNVLQMDDVISDATGVMRQARGLKPGEDNNFDIKKSDGVLEELKEMTSKIRAATLAIALITLLGAAIGLMNIMLVSVTERTKEIGIRKALGATKNNIKAQFLTEAIVICQIGGIMGIILGILIGFLVSLAIKGSFVIPWMWMLVAFIVCIIVGIIAGLYPALKAAKLDPIESLRYD